MRAAKLNAIHVTPYQRRYRQQVQDLLFYSHHVHTHLDWYELENWLELYEPPLRLAWDRGVLVGVLGASVPLNGTSWLRVVGVLDQHPPEEILEPLWSQMRPLLAAQGARSVWLLAAQNWVTRYMGFLDFAFFEDIVTFRRHSHDLPPLRETEIEVRSIAPPEMEQKVRIDQRAFAPPWQLNLTDMRQAIRIAATCTVAALDDRVIGYQLSTTYHGGAHLARLAVAPEMQGQRVGAYLLDDLLQRFMRRGIYTMTVNTQVSNRHSQRLYTRYNFRRNGFDLPVWSYQMES